MKIVISMIFFSTICFCQIDEFIEKAISKVGGKEAFKKINSLYIEGTESAGGDNVNWKMKKYFQRPSKWYQSDGDDFYWRRDGEQTFEKNKNGKWVKCKSEMNNALLRLSTIDNKFIDYKEKKIKFEIIENENSQGVLVLKMKYPDGYESLEYFDSESGLHLASEFDAGMGVEKQFYYRYKKYGTIYLPTVRVTVFINQDVAPHVFTIDSVKINPDFSSIKFNN